jgi:hypothetical protein
VDESERVHMRRAHAEARETHGMIPPTSRFASGAPRGELRGVRWDEARPPRSSIPKPFAFAKAPSFCP